MQWTKREAIASLKSLSDDTDLLAQSTRFSAEHMRWLTNAIAILTEIFGANSTITLSIRALRWTSQSGIIGGAADIQGLRDPAAAMEREHHKAYLRSLDSARGLLLAGIDQLERADNIADVYEGKDTPEESSLILKVINLADRKLRKVIRKEPTKEVEVQEAFENLLIGADIPYSRESISIEYSSKTYKPDFVIEKIDLAIDIKLCAREGREKEIIAEINDDIMAYGTQYSNLLFVIYDVGQIRDRDQFSHSFEANEHVVISIVKH